VREVPERAIGLPRSRTVLKRRSPAPSTAASPDPTPEGPYVAHMRITDVEGARVVFAIRTERSG